MELFYMKKYDNFTNCLSVLKKVDSEKAKYDEIYRTGVIGQYNLTFELAWKLLQAVLKLHGVSGADVGSPREILKLAYKAGFINEEDIWLKMLKDRNTFVHIYYEEEIDKLVALIISKYIPVFERLKVDLIDKINIDD